MLGVLTAASALAHAVRQIVERQVEGGPLRQVRQRLRLAGHDLHAHRTVGALPVGGQQKGIVRTGAAGGGAAGIGDRVQFVHHFCLLVLVSQESATANTGSCVTTFGNNGRRAHTQYNQSINHTHKHTHARTRTLTHIRCDTTTTHAKVRSILTDVVEGVRGGRQQNTTTCSRRSLGVPDKRILTGWRTTNGTQL